MSPGRGRLPEKGDSGGYDCNYADQRGDTRDDSSGTRSAGEALGHGDQQDSNNEGLFFPTVNGPQHGQEENPHKGERGHDDE